MPLQSVSPLWQESAHLPAEQTSPERHAVPHTPQWARSVLRLTQVPLQSDRPLWQESAHLPAEQTSPERHAVPHAPQLSRSLLRFTQVPVQSLKPLPQALPASGAVWSGVEASFTAPSATPASCAHVVGSGQSLSLQPARARAAAAANHGVLTYIRVCICRLLGEISIYHRSLPGKIAR